MMLKMKILILKFILCIWLMAFCCDNSDENTNQKFRDFLIITIKQTLVININTIGLDCWKQKALETY